MKLQARKLELIEHLLQIKDENIINQIEYLVDQSTLEPFSQEELISRANQSNLDYEAGKFKTKKQLEKNSSHW